MNKVYEDLIASFVKGAEKQERAMLSGGFGHALFCNYQTEKGNGEERCNCGVADIASALSKFKELKNTPPAKQEVNEPEIPLDICENCGQAAWDGYICHSCGHKNI